MSTVTQWSNLTIRFSLALENGQLIDSCFEGEPATFTMGDGSLLPGFERQLLGMTQGQRKQFTIRPEDGFGQRNRLNVQNMSRDKFAGIELEKGLILSIQNGELGELPGVVNDFNDNTVEIDFNHPLAGKTLEFDVLVEAIENPDAD
jgi:FKBP-type peptidyl-prolyl cis-trans isomerase SlpA